VTIELEVFHTPVLYKTVYI